jgi:hypothetical protein
MASDRPMSEHEGALFDAVRVLGTTILDIGADPKVLNSRLTEARNSAHALGNTHGAATIDFLINALFPQTGPAPKPSFRIV